MAGYMGFGMARWIYTQRPRKAFSKRKRRSTCNTISTYNRTFKLQPSFKSSRLPTILSLLIVGLLFLCFFVKAPEVVEYFDSVEAIKQERLERENKEAFQFLMRSGIYRLRGENYIGAYSEFKLAYAIDPKNEHLYELMLETLSVLCDKENIYCKDLELLLNDNLH